MSENTIYPLARSLQHTSGLEQNLHQMLAALHSSIETEYLQKIRTAAKEEKTFSAEHPPREVTLLRALSAFADENGREQIDRMTQSLLFLHTMQHIQQNVQELSSGALLAVRSAEGQAAEELPSAHCAQMAGLLLTLALAERF
ncbi:MAG: hypothetical protein IJA25_01430 [Anaerotignum sp.]|nr:hypothetical protein [Anaerotignum sp.]